MARRAGFYSNAVAILKICLPLIAVAILILVFVVEREDDFDDGGLAFTEADVQSLGQGLQLTNPQLSGTTAIGEQYILSAATIAPVNISPDHLMADTLSGTLSGDERRIDFSADQAEIEVGAKRLTLTRGLSVETSDGYTLTAPRVEANLRTSTLVADGPVKATGPIGAITAGNLEISPEPETQNRVIWFRDGVTVRYTPAKQE